MKRVINFSAFTCLIVWVFLLFLASQSMADTYCVSDEANLISALNDTKDNGADDVIKIQQGTYNGNFVYASSESFGLTVEGGYTALGYAGRCFGDRIGIDALRPQTDPHCRIRNHGAGQDARLLRSPCSSNNSDHCHSARIAGFLGVFDHS